MSIQEICDLIDENLYKENSYYLSITDPEEFAKQVALEFGKQCFEAGRDKEYDKVDGDYYDKFRDFDDYLKSL